MAFSYYIRPAMVNWKATIALLTKAIKESGIKFDAIAVRGTSGLLVGPAVASELNVALMVVRKQNESPHACSNVEFNHEHESVDRIIKDSFCVRYIIIDDCVCSGSTFREICQTVEKQNYVDKTVEMNQSAVCQAVFLYNPDKYTQPKTELEVCKVPVYRVIQ